MSATFERGAFEAALDEVGSLLGDLWAVDEALKLGDADAVRESGGTPTPYGRAGVDVGRHHGFRYTIFWGAPESADGTGGGFPSGGQAPGDGAQALVDELAATGRTWGRGVADSIRSMVKDLVRPVPSSFEDAVQAMRGEIISPLSTQIADNFAHLDSLSDWEGDAAGQFTDYFYTQVEASVRNQVFAAEAVCVGLAGSKAIVHLGQHSLMGLVLSAKEAIDQQLQERKASHEVGGMSTSDLLLLGATFLALAAAIPTGGGSLTLAAGASAAASATGALLEFGSSQVEDGETTTFEVTTAEETMNQLSDQLTEIRTRVRTHWGQLEDSMGQLRDLVVEAEASHLLSPRRPHLMADGAVSPHGWHHESAPR